MVLKNCHIMSYFKLILKIYGQDTFEDFFVNLYSFSPKKRAPRRLKNQWDENLQSSESLKGWNHRKQ